MASELKEYGIMVNVLLPGGAVDTGGLPEDPMRALPFELLLPDIMDDPIVFLASNLADGISGERIIAKEFGEWVEKYNEQLAIKNN
jgi:gluconate 5-dehydrogenase